MSDTIEFDWIGFLLEDAYEEERVRAVTINILDEEPQDTDKAERAKQIKEAKELVREAKKITKYARNELIRLVINYRGTPEKLDSRIVSYIGQLLFLTHDVGHDARKYFDHQSRKFDRNQHRNFRIALEYKMITQNRDSSYAIGVLEEKFALSDSSIQKAIETHGASAAASLERRDLAARRI